MPQNHGPRARPWANVPLPDGPWAPFLAVAAVLATVALVAHGPRIGGDPPAVPDGRTYATADAGGARAGDDRSATADADAPPDAGTAVAARDPSRAEPVAATTASAAPRPRRRTTPASSHRERRAAASRARPRPTRGRRRTPRPAAPRPSRPATIAADTAPAPVRSTSVPHRRSAAGSAEREFGAP